MSTRHIETQSLAVKYRPKSFSDYAGQTSAVAILTAMAKKDKFDSSFLISGRTGTGKTTLARILASYIQCEKPDKTLMVACGKCASCRAIGNHPDTIELNAANHRGIDEIRALIAQSQNMPTMGNKRIYIADEMQQLTDQAQKALLKEAEEPPPHTVWILPTMQPEKLTAALRSRCTNIALHPVDEAACVERLYAIGKKEGVRFKDIEDGMKILSAIASASCGCMRDAVQILGRVLLLLDSSKKVDYKEILKEATVGSEQEQEVAAAKIVAAWATNNIEMFLQAAYSTTNCMQLLLYTRWLIDYLFQAKTGTAKYTPYSAKMLFKEKAKPKYTDLISLYAALTRAENLIMQGGADKACFVAALGTHFKD